MLLLLPLPPALPCIAAIAAMALLTPSLPLLPWCHQCCAFIDASLPLVLLLLSLHWCHCHWPCCCCHCYCWCLCCCCCCCFVNVLAAIVAIASIFSVAGIVLFSFFWVAPGAAVAHWHPHCHCFIDAITAMALLMPSLLFVPSLPSLCWCHCWIYSTSKLLHSENFEKNEMVYW